MDGNKDEADKCVNIAKKYLSEGDFVKAKKFAEKSVRLYPLKEAEELLKDINTKSEEGGFDNVNSETRYRKNSQSNKHNRRRVNSNTKEEPIYTQEQLEAVRKIQNSKDFYEILGVEKDAADDDLKRSYKKLALKFHPDKNKAPGATEAFKLIGKSFAVLSDPKKRKQYDLTGNVDETQQIKHNGNRYYYDCSRGFDSEYTAEEIFNLFFGAGVTSFTNSHRTARFTRTQGVNSERENSSYAWIQFLPLIFLLLMSIFSSVFVKDPLFQLLKSEKYTIERITVNRHFPYYVKPTFEKELGRMSLHQLERDVESEFINDLRYKCLYEKQQRESLIFRARYYGDEESYQKYSAVKLPHCQKLEDIYGG